MWNQGWFTRDSGEEWPQPLWGTAHVARPSTRHQPRPPGLRNPDMTPRGCLSSSSHHVFKYILRHLFVLIKTLLGRKYCETWNRESLVPTSGRCPGPQLTCKFLIRHIPASAAPKVWQEICPEERAITFSTGDLTVLLWQLLIMTIPNFKKSFINYSQELLYILLLFWLLPLWPTCSCPHSFIHPVILLINPYHLRVISNILLDCEYFSVYFLKIRTSR